MIGFITAFHSYLFYQSVVCNYRMKCKCRFNLNSYGICRTNSRLKKALRVLCVGDVYYDSDNDGYVDSSSEWSYLVAPIEQYNERFGELID